MNDFKLGFDYALYNRLGISVIIRAPLHHTIIVGGTGSGKSTSVLYWLAGIKKADTSTELYIADFKNSGDFTGITSTDKYACFEKCYDLICSFYDDFLNTPEGNSIPKILIVDEIAGMLSFLSMDKENKGKADKIRSILSSVLMLGRSRSCYIWLCMQRFSASIFPSGSGAVDNFHIVLGLGRLTVEGRKSLFASMHFDGEDELVYSQGRGIVFVDGQPLKGIIIPYVDKEKIKALLRRAPAGKQTASPSAPSG